jgi:hypothetical protein
MSDDTAGFRLDVDSLEEFFLRCIARKAETREERMIVLKELVYELRAIKLTGQDVKRMMKGKKVLKIGHNAGPEHWCNECKPKESK